MYKKTFTEFAEARLKGFLSLTAFKGDKYRNTDEGRRVTTPLYTTNIVASVSALKCERNPTKCDKTSPDS